jgi:hypothetical protein
MREIYKYEYKVESLDYCGIFDTGVLFTNTPIENIKLEEVIINSQTYKEIEEQLIEEVQDEFDKHGHDDGEPCYVFSIII